MSKKLKNHRYIYSVFSVELQDYPYYPFIAENHKAALSKFISFISNRVSICEGAELHCIGECKVNQQGIIIDGSEQPFAIPYIVNFKNNFISKTFIVAEYYRLKIEKYLSKLVELSKKGICYGKKRNEE